MNDARALAGEGELLWEPSADRCAASRMAHFMRWLARDTGQDLASYAELWRWSVEQVGPFWQAVARYFEVQLGGSSEPALVGKLPEAHWFPTATLNYAQRLLRRTDEHLAIVARARNVAHYYRLRERGVTMIERETLDSALMSARSVLQELGWQPHHARQQAMRFRAHSVEQIERMWPHAGNQTQLVSIAKEGRQQLEELFGEERAEVQARSAQGWGDTR